MPVQYEAKGSKHALSIIDSTKWTRNLAPKCIYLLNAYDRINESNMSWWTIRCKKCGWIGFFPNYGFRFVALSCARVCLCVRVESLQRLSTSFYWFAGGHGSNISPWPMKLLMVWKRISRLITLTYLQIFVLSVDKVLLSTCWWWHFKWQFAYKCLLNAGRCLLAVVLCESAYHKTWQDIKNNRITLKWVL